MPGPRPIRLFQRLLIADRGETAARIARTCDALGITPVFAVSEADRGAPYVRGRATVCVGPADPWRSYRDAKAVLQAAKQTRCQALHPGCGVLARSPAFAALCVTHGVTFVGPPAHVIARAMSRAPDHRAMAQAGPRALASGAPRDALAPSLRRVHVQILADRYGEVIHLGERDCTMRRGGEKLIEESPAPTLSETQRRRLWMAAVNAARTSGLVGAGTVELVVGRSGSFRVDGIAPHLQVEHGVTEMLTGLDLVREQILVAAGHGLRLAQGDLSLQGHAIACSVHAEDPSEEINGSHAAIERWQAPDTSDGNLRVDTHVERGYRLPSQYDSLLCKLIARGLTREVARDRMLVGLEELVCRGVPTTVPLHAAVLASGQWLRDDYDTTTIPSWPPPIGALRHGTRTAATYRRTA